MFPIEGFGAEAYDLSTGGLRWSLPLQSHRTLLSWDDQITFTGSSAGGAVSLSTLPALSVIVDAGDVLDLAESGTVRVRVMSGTAPVEGARVLVRSTCWTDVSGFTDGSGEFSFEWTAPDTMGVCGFTAEAAAEGYPPGVGRDSVIVGRELLELIDRKRDLIDRLRSLGYDESSIESQVSLWLSGVGSADAENFSRLVLAEEVVNFTYPYGVEFADSLTDSIAAFILSMIAVLDGLTEIAATSESGIVREVAGDLRGQVAETLALFLEHLSSAEGVPEDLGQAMSQAGSAVSLTAGSVGGIAEFFVEEGVNPAIESAGRGALMDWYVSETQGSLDWAASQAAAGEYGGTYEKARAAVDSWERDATAGFEAALSAIDLFELISNATDLVSEVIGILSKVPVVGELTEMISLLNALIQTESNLYALSLSAAGMVSTAEGTAHGVSLAFYPGDPSSGGERTWTTPDVDFEGFRDLLNRMKSGERVSIDEFSEAEGRLVEQMALAGVRSDDPLSAFRAEAGIILTSAKVRACIIAGEDPAPFLGDLERSLDEASTTFRRLRVDASKRVVVISRVRLEGGKLTVRVSNPTEEELTAVVSFLTEANLTSPPSRVVRISPGGSVEVWASAEEWRGAHTLISAAVIGGSTTYYYVPPSERVSQPRPPEEISPPTETAHAPPLTSEGPRETAGPSGNRLSELARGAIRALKRFLLPAVLALVAAALAAAYVRKKRVREEEIREKLEKLDKAYREGRISRELYLELKKRYEERQHSASEGS